MTPYGQESCLCAPRGFGQWGQVDDFLLWTTDQEGLPISRNQFPSLQQERQEELSEDVGRGMLGKVMEEMSCFECQQEVN